MLPLTQINTNAQEFPSSSSSSCTAVTASAHRREEKLFKVKRAKLESKTLPTLPSFTQSPPASLALVPSSSSSSSSLSLTAAPSQPFALVPSSSSSSSSSLSLTPLTPPHAKVPSWKITNAFYKADLFLGNIAIVKKIYEIAFKALQENPSAKHIQVDGPLQLKMDIFPQGNRVTHLYVFFPDARLNVPCSAKRVSSAVQFTFQHEIPTNCRRVARLVLSPWIEVSRVKAINSFKTEVQVLSKIAGDQFGCKMLDASPAALVPTGSVLEPNENHFMYMKYYDGDLFSISNTNHPFKLFYPLIFKSLLQQLQVLHERGFIHHDIKPENILYKLKDQSFEICLADFGSANGAWSGTRMFLPPEDKFDVSAKLSQVGDIWALGLTFFNLINGGWLTWVGMLDDMVRLLAIYKNIGKKLEMDDKKESAPPRDVVDPNKDLTDYFVNAAKKMEECDFSSFAEVGPYELIANAGHLARELRDKLFELEEHVQLLPPNRELFEAVGNLIKVYYLKFDETWRGLPKNIDKTINMLNHPECQIDEIEKLLRKIVLLMIHPQPEKRLTPKQLLERYGSRLDAASLGNMSKMAKQSPYEAMLAKYMEYPEPKVQLDSQNFFEMCQAIKSYFTAPSSYKPVNNMMALSLENVFKQGDGEIRAYFKLAPHSIRKNSSRQFENEFCITLLPNGTINGNWVREVRAIDGRILDHKKEIDVMTKLARHDFKHFLYPFNEFHTDKVSLRKQEFALESLYDALTRGVLPASYLPSFINAIFHQLSALKATGIVHANITPYNIYVVPDYHHPSLKLTNLSSANTNLTERWLYAPERWIATNPENYMPGPKDDVWSMGLIMMSLLNGHNHPRWILLQSLVTRLNGLKRKAASLDEQKAADGEKKGQPVINIEALLRGYYTKLLKLSPKDIASFEPHLPSDASFLKMMDEFYKLLEEWEKFWIPQNSENTQKLIDYILRQCDLLVKNAFEALAEVVSSPIDPSKFSSESLLARQIACAMLNPDPTKRPDIATLWNTFGDSLKALLSK